MKLHELLSRLAAFDPEYEVVAMRGETDWASIDLRAPWVGTSDLEISQDQSGKTKIGNPDPGEQE